MSSNVIALVGSIPSPSSNQIHLGPLSLNFYGLCIGLGVLAAVWIGQRRWMERGGDPEDVAAVATWAVPAGLIGARAYHVITDWRPIEDWLKIWEGGLGIPGGLIAGIGVGVWAARRRGMDLGQAVDALIPGIPVAQAMGRFGNWFNQEIFGGPSNLPWAVEIDPQHRPAQYADQATFHPAFLYEAIWNLALAAFLVWIDRRGRLRKGMILPIYVLGYGIGRFLVESIRTDAATHLLGIRVNHWMSGAAVVLSLVALAVMARRSGPSYHAPGGAPDHPVDTDPDTDTDPDPEPGTASDGSDPDGSDRGGSDRDRSDGDGSEGLGSDADDLDAALHDSRD